ncbi:MAG: hypothetical protein AAGF32_08860, partial [Pseudomonadota bacterium]
CGLPCGGRFYFAALSAWQPPGCMGSVWAVLAKQVDGDYGANAGFAPTPVKARASDMASCAIL